MDTITLNLNPIIPLTQEDFYKLCQTNPDVKFELNFKGELIIMSPTGGETGKFNLSIGAQLWFWNDENQLGVAFDSSTGFILPNGSIRSPDLAWIKISRWQGLSAEEREKFIPLCPDFVIEILSPSDTLIKTQAKMQEYMENGCALGWLINRKKQEVEIYRFGKNMEIVSKPTQLFGENILPGFSLNLPLSN